MRIVFIGASKFGARCLTTLLEMKEVKIVGAVTAPQTFSISYKPDGITNVLHSDMHALCAPKQIPCLELTNGMNDEKLLSAVSEWKPDAFIVAGWYHMLTKKWRDIATAYGLHASLLPKYSGGAPLVWAIINGEKETGITLFQFDAGVDNGAIIGQASTSISSDDTIATLYARIEDLGLDLIKKYIPQLADGSAQFQVQDESKRTTFPQRSPDDGKIDWSQKADRIYDFVRAQTKPYPGAFTDINGHKVSIWKSLPANLNISSTAGSFILKDNKVIFSCGENSSLEILEISIDDSPADISALSNI